MTINRSCKDIGGLSGKTQDEGGREGWTRTNHLMVAMRDHLKKKIRKQTRNLSRELGVQKIGKDENDVRSIQTCLERWVPDLWKPTQPIVQFSTGADEMRNDTLDTQMRGASERDNFLAALTSDDSKKKLSCFIRRIPRRKI